MSYLDAVLVAEARRAGRAQRSAQFRHVHLTKKPLGLLLWQLGAEPFTAAAVAWGFGPRKRSLVVPGEPRDRELAFRALTEVAHDFNTWFEGGAGGEPQIVVPNRGNLTLIGRLGRRLAYLPTDGERPADPELVRFGKHLSFLASHARCPGQQLLVVLTQMLGNHWVSELSSLEAQNLPALDAVIDPPPGKRGHEAAADAERLEIGPLPSERDDGVVIKLLAKFNERRQRSTDAATIAKLLPPIHRHYAGLVDRGWPLLWRVLERERAYPEAHHADRRWQADMEDLARHLEWVVVKAGHTRTRQSFALAARTLRGWEDAQRLLVAEQAIDDPLKMLPYERSHQALRGRVVAVDENNTERPNTKWVKRPLLTVRTDQPCRVAVDTVVHWTGAPGTSAFEVVEIQDVDGGSTVVLKQTSGMRDGNRPDPNREATFSVHHTRGSPWLMLPAAQPWTHVAAAAPTAAIEDPETARGWE